MNIVYERNQNSNKLKNFILNRNQDLRILFFESLKFLIENRCPEFNEQFSWKLPKRAFINLLKLPSNNNYIVRTLSQIFSIVYSEMTFNKNSYLWVSEWCLKKKYRRCLLLTLSLVTFLYAKSLALKIMKSIKHS